MVKVLLQLLPKKGMKVDLEGVRSELNSLVSLCFATTNRYFIEIPYSHIGKVLRKKFVQSY